MAGEQTNGRRVSDAELAAMNVTLQHIQATATQTWQAVDTLRTQVAHINEEQALRKGRLEALEARVSDNQAAIKDGRRWVFGALTGVIAALGHTLWQLFSKGGN